MEGKRGGGGRERGKGEEKERKEGRERGKEKGGREGEGEAGRGEKKLIDYIQRTDGERGGVNEGIY